MSTVTRPGPSAKPEFSVIVCSRNRREQLLRTVRHIGGLGWRRPWELLVVDNASTDGTRPALDACQATAQFPLRILHQDRPGLGRAKNTALEAASGDIVAFTDDDCYPEADWLDALAECFLDPSVAYVGGKVTLFDREDVPITIQLRNERWEIPPGSVIKAGSLLGANLAIRRDALLAIGGFDPRFGPGAFCKSGVDVEVMARLSAAGYLGIYDPRPSVAHHHGRRTEAEIRALMHRYAVGRGACYAKALMDRTMRPKVARAWYWSLREHVASGSWRDILGEVEGAVRFGAVAVRPFGSSLR